MNVPPFFWGDGKGGVAKHITGPTIEVVCLFVCLFVRLFVRLFVCSFVRSLVCLFVCLFVCFVCF